MERRTETCGVVDGFTIPVIDEQRKKYSAECHICFEQIDYGTILRCYQLMRTCGPMITSVIKWEV